MAGRLNQKKINAKNVICGIFQNSNWGWESKTNKAESAAQLQKKELEFCTMADDDGYTALRVHEPVG